MAARELAPSSNEIKLFNGLIFFHILIPIVKINPANPLKHSHEETKKSNALIYAFD
jgi:hypothetical protein